MNDDEIQRLQIKFQEFKRDREKVHELLSDYVADYRQFEGTSTARYEHLQRKFLSKSPSLSHLVSIDGSFLWSVNDISIILGRHRTTIQRTLDKLEKSECWCAKLLALRETSKAPSGLKIFVYHQEIFDLIIDRYEEEYLLRFSQPRRGNEENAPDIDEVRRFWKYLKDYYSIHDFAVHNDNKFLPDIPLMTLKDILSLIWEKVFNIKISTVASIIFAVCFEIARRFFGVNLLFGIIPSVITLTCVLLIYRRKFSPDALSNLGAGALLFTLLWISAALSIPNSEIKNKTVKQNILLTPTRAGEKNIFFQISHNIPNIKEFLYCISPDNVFHSTGFLQQINPNNNSPYPNTSIQISQTDGIAYIDVKFIDEKNIESPIWHFSFDVSFEYFKLNKNYILNTKQDWVEIYHYIGNYETNEIITELLLNPLLLFYESKNSVKYLLYGINTKTPNIEVSIENYKPTTHNRFSPNSLFMTSKNDIDFVSSQIVFLDGSSSDVRIYN